MGTRVTELECSGTVVKWPLESVLQPGVLIAFFFLNLFKLLDTHEMYCSFMLYLKPNKCNSSLVLSIVGGNFIFDTPDMPKNTLS